MLSIPNLSNCRLDSLKSHLTFQALFTDTHSSLPTFALQPYFILAQCLCSTTLACQAKTYSSLFSLCSSVHLVRDKQLHSVQTSEKQLNLPSKYSKLQTHRRKSMRWTFRKIRLKLIHQSSKEKSSLRMSGSDTHYAQSNGYSKD